MSILDYEDYGKYSCTKSRTLFDYQVTTCGPQYWKNNKKQVEFQTTAFKVPYFPGHPKNVEFFYLLNQLDVNLMETQIKNLVNFRWGQAQYYININFVIYFLLAVFMTV